MIGPRLMYVDAYFLKDGRFFFYCVDEDGLLVRANHWKPLLFQWHESSYYGTKLKVDGFMGKEGIFIDPFDVLELFAKETFNRFIQWEFSDELHPCMSVAPVMYECIVNRSFIPDFKRWDQGELQWQVPERVWDEFHPSFWEETFIPFTYVDQPVSMKTFVSNWFHHAAESFMEKSVGLKAIWNERKQALQKAADMGIPLSTYFDEERFSVWAGMKESPLPFTFGLHLEEPHEDGGMWKLQVVLRDRLKNEHLYTLEDMPRKWSVYMESIREEEERICRMVPWLEDESGQGLKNELFENEAWEFLTDASEMLLLLGIEILLPSWWQQLKEANLKIKARVATSTTRPSFVGLNDVMQFNWRLSMNGAELSEDEFLKLVEEKRRLVYIRGRWVKLDPSFIKRIQRLMEKAEQEGMRVQDVIQQQLLYEDGRMEDEMDDDEQNPHIFSKIRIELHPKLRSFVRSLSDVKQIPKYPVPKGLNGELRPYQQEGMSWLYYLRTYGFGACLADDMGLGKTIQYISYLLLVKEREKTTGPSLIICPTSVLGNWQKEFERFSPELKVYLHYGSNRRKGDGFQKEVAHADVVLTSYGLAHLDFDELSSIEWESIALDEAQNIKNADTKQSRAVRKLKGKQHIALTGTPMENRLTELWSIFDFINKGYLGSLTRFYTRFVSPIEKEHKTEKIEELRRLIRPFLLRRTKRDEDVALNLPEKLEQKEYCPLTTEQAALYEYLVKDTFEKINGLSAFERKGIILQMIGRLKQLCDHPALYLKEETPKDLIKRSTKLEKLVELFETIFDNDERGLIFTQYIGMGEMIQQVFAQQFGVNIPFLNGSVSKKHRDEMISRFQNGEYPALLLSLKAGGTGLNLTAANHVIHYDRWWNPAVENQATDRAYRIGQTRFVHVHKFITSGTLEEKIDKMLEQKQALNEEIIQSDQWIANLSDEDLHEILKLG